jgi:hypothetical protein
VPMMIDRGMRLFGGARADLCCTEAIRAESAIYLHCQIR